jgi:protoporphyrinogen oxidase
MVEVAVVGGGIAGLAAAYKLEQYGIKFDLYEKNSAVGGLLRNFEVDGYRFDHAIHLSFATESEVREIFDQTPFITHKPESKCSYSGLWLRHPVQNNLSPLPNPEKVEIIESFINRPEREIANYDDWLRYQFGDVFTDRFPKPYTEKYWDCEPKHLGTDWIGSRMHRASIREVLEGAFQSDVPNYYYAKEMRYPKEGGYYAFLTPLIEKTRHQTKLHHQVASIDLNRKRLAFTNGVERGVDKLISTMPLPELISVIKDVPDNIAGLAKKLEWTRVHLVSFGFNRPDVVKDLWFYIYDEDIFASRAYSPSLKSLDNVPEGKSSIQFEIYESSNNPEKFKYEDIVDNCFYAIEKLDIASKKDVVVTDSRTLEFGNVTFYKGMEADRDIIKNWLAEQGVHLAGRFGKWEYLWSNQALVSGFSSALAVKDSYERV